MSVVETSSAVLTLDEVAAYLRVPPEAVRELADEGAIPGRRVGKDWRFLKLAIDEWLLGTGSAHPGPARESLRRQLGRFADDETLGPLRDSAYARRGRPESAGPDPQ